MHENEKRILIADDNENYRNSIKRMLESYGYEVKEAKNSDEAIKMAEKEKYDYIITDNDMQDGYASSGLHLIEGVRKSKNNSQTPILLSSSHIPEEVAKKAEELGAETSKKVDFFQKVKKFLEK